MGFWRLSLLGFGGLGWRKSASPPPPLARSHHHSIARQKGTSTVTLRPIKGAAVLIKEGVRLIAVGYRPGAVGGSERT